MTFPALSKKVFKGPPQPQGQTAAGKKVPVTFDPSYYRQRYRDVRSLSDKELRRHWRSEGRKKGRNAAPFENREQLLECVIGLDLLLEIGPFDKPSLQFLVDHGTTIHYADYLSRSELIDRARKTPGRSPDGVPNINYVLSNGGYQQIKAKYDAVVSHHCIEHQPDLVDHFIQISRILKESGFYICTLPNHRMCFDHFLPPTNLVDLITAHTEKRSRPSLYSVIEHRCFTEHNWNSATDPLIDLRPNLRDLLHTAITEHEDNDYVDVHCWKFTRKSLSLNLRHLIHLGFLPSETKFRTYSLGSEIVLIASFFKAAHDLY